MKKIMIQKITQNNRNLWTVNLIMRAKKLLSSRQIFRYAVPARTVTKKALPVCDLLLVINSNWHPISYRFGVIAAYCSNFAQTRSLRLKISGRRGRPPPIIFVPIDRPMNALQLYPWQFSHRCYGWGATSENRSKIGDFAPMRSLWSKISGTRGRHPPIIFARLVGPMNVLQLCRWQFSYKETL